MPLAEKTLEYAHAARMCPVCGGPSRVSRSGELPDGTIRRERLCRDCGNKFKTLERLHDAELEGK